MTPNLNIYLFPCFLLGFLFILISIPKTSILSIKINEKHEYIRQVSIKKQEKYSGKVIPVCVNNILDKSKYQFEKIGTDNNFRLVSQTSFRHSCRLLKYTVELVVTCFDGLSREQVISHSYNFHNNTKNKPKPKPMLHFVFIGDSRIRQQYYNFLQLIPNYDRQTQPNHIKQNGHLFNHGDVDWYSRILNLRVSYKWRPIINDSVMEMMNQWAVSDRIQRPNLIFLSIEVHHLLIANGNDFKLYKKKLKECGRTLGLLAKASKVIWLNQYPIIEFFGNTHAHNTDIHSGKVHQYNEASMDILRNITDIRIWDSSNVLVEEYIRGCTIFPEREMQHPVFEIKETPFNPITCKPYISCLDYIHTGYIALSQATQILYNDICNKETHNFFKT